LSEKWPGVMFDYRARVIDVELSERLTSIGAVLIDGPKGCRKTETALQRAKSSVRFDTDPNARALLGLNPDELFDQETPILFDELAARAGDMGPGTAACR
jgi:hypothetical protein